MGLRKRNDAYEYTVDNLIVDGMDRFSLGYYFAAPGWALSSVIVMGLSVSSIQHKGGASGYIAEQSFIFRFTGSAASSAPPRSRSS